MKKLFVLLVVLLLACSKEVNENSFKMNCELTHPFIEATIYSDIKGNFVFYFNIDGNLTKYQTGLKTGKNDITFPTQLNKCPDYFSFIKMDYQ